MAEIPNNASHSLIPGDFFVIVNDPEETVYLNIDVREPFAPYLLLSRIKYPLRTDMQVLRVDGDLLTVNFIDPRNPLNSFSSGKIISKEIDASKIDYKRISRLPFEV